MVPPLAPRTIAALLMVLAASAVRMPATASAWDKGTPACPAPTTIASYRVESIEASLNPKHVIGFVRGSRRLMQLLRNQIELEQADATAAQSTGGSLQSEAVADFSRLERKYAIKPRTAPIELDRRAHA